MAGQSQANLDKFEAYFRKADLDQDGRISGNEAVIFFQGSNLPRQVLAQIWQIADQNRTGFLGHQEFCNALKLVTVAQSKRELTPDIVKAALYGPASAAIPPPRIIVTPTQSQQSSVTTASSSVPQQAAVMTMGSPSSGARSLDGFSSQQPQVMQPIRPISPGASFQSPQFVASPIIPPHGSNRGVSYPTMTSTKASGNTVSNSMGINSQGNNVTMPSVQDGLSSPLPGLPSSKQPIVQVSSMSPLPASSTLNDTPVGGEGRQKNSRALTVGGIGHAVDSLFGNVFTESSVQTKQESPKVKSFDSSSPAPSTIVPASSSLQSTGKSSSSESLSSTPAPLPISNQHPQAHMPQKSSQKIFVQASALPTGATISGGQSQPLWPKMTQSDVQKYSKVFLQVDTDSDGKITGEQARNLFLSWRMPRDVLKQVWDLSDQDNDSMLSLREFCIALYLMERYREGRPLPATLPSNIMLDETLFAMSNQPAAAVGNAVWKATPGFQHPQVSKGAQAAAFPGAGKPPRPVPVLQPEGAVPPVRQKPKVPVLEKHLLDQLSTEEQSSLNAKLQEATEAEKKVSELEKEISDAREKIKFYNAKMQELILYKSRCDNRLNEIYQRVSADKLEVEKLGKKYEEKYRQAGDVASKLTLEEATFRDIQEKKIELYRAIVKLEQDGGDDKIQERVSHIQVDLEELVKSLNERCKSYGLRGKPTSLVELPFGWQPGIQGTAADWDENWDKFEDEGFTFVKELTLDMQNVIAPPRPKSTLVRENKTLVDESVVAKSSLDGHAKAEVQHAGQRTLKDGEDALGEGRRLDSSPERPAQNSGVESKSRVLEDSKKASSDGPARAAQSEQGGAKSMLPGDGGFDDPGWGTLDSEYDAEAAWDSNRASSKDPDFQGQHDSYLFDTDGWNLQPIRTGPSYADHAPSKQGPLFDSVPSTPMNNSVSSPQADNLFQGKSIFFDSVPSTPMYNSSSTPHADNISVRQSPFFDSVPSTPVYNFGSTPHADNVSLDKSPFAFADSVPSSPMYNSGNSPRRFDSFDMKNSSQFSRFDSFNAKDSSQLSRFDSFSMQDGGLFTPRESSLSRFDSMRSTQDSGFDNGSFAAGDSFARFDSFRSTADSDYNFGLFPPRDSLARFDSMRSTRDADQKHGFSSFDDADPFGSHDPFKTSMESHKSTRDSDSWKDF